MKHYVEIVETLCRTEEIEADNPSDAVSKITDIYNNEEIVLDAEDYADTEFSIVRNITDE